MNQATLIGRAGKDPDVRTTQSGKKVASMSLATSRKVNGEDVTQWHRLVLWEKLAETAEKYVHKGDQVCVQGEIVYREYTDEGGQTRPITEINVRNLELLGSKKSSNGDKTQAPEPKKQDDIPF